MEQGRILLVDEHLELASGLRAALQHEPFELLWARSPGEALDVLAREAVDVVVSDERPTGVSGVAFLARVRARHPDALRVILTEHGGVEAAMQAINEAAVFRFLAKPYEPADLASCLRDAMAQRQRARAGALTRARSRDDAAATHFEHALASLWMAAQPVVSLATRDVFAYELLVRAHDRELGTPEALFACAEQLGRVADLERAIAARAAALIAASPPETRFLVNLHPASVSAPWLLAPDAPLAPFAARVTFELPERARLDAVADLDERLAALRARGYGVAIDDLGAGFAGLASVAQTAPDLVKLDMTLVRGIEGSPVKARLVRALRALCEDVRCGLIAEGVETVPEARALAALGCDLMQGYLFARPARAFPRLRWPDEVGA